MIEYGLDNDAILYSKTVFTEDGSNLFEIFLQTANHDFMKIESHARYFDLSDNGHFLYYINQKNEVIQYEVDSQIEKVITTGYERVLTLDTIDALLLQKSNKSVDLYYKETTYSFAKSMETIDDETILCIDDSIYFIDAQASIGSYSNLTALLEPINQSHEPDGQLYAISDVNTSKLLTDNVDSVTGNQDSLYYITSDGYLYAFQEGESTNLSTNFNLEYSDLLQQSVLNDDVVYLATDGTLTINDKSFNLLCESAAYENGIVAAFTLDDEVHYINPKTLESQLLLDETSNYDEIYLGNQLLKYREFEYPEEEDVRIEPVIPMTGDLETLASSKSFSPDFKAVYFNDSSSYITPHSLDMYLNANELFYYTRDELALIRNEIFARYGYIFDSEFYRAYFKSKNWYTEVSKNVNISNIAQMNVDLILSLENGGLSLPDDYLGNLSATDAYNILINAYPNYVPIRYYGIIDGTFHWGRQQEELAFDFYFQSTLFDDDNFYHGFVFSDGTYQLKYAPIMD